MLQLHDLKDIFSVIKVEYLAHEGQQVICTLFKDVEKQIQAVYRERSKLLLMFSKRQCEAEHLKPLKEVSLGFDRSGFRMNVMNFVPEPNLESAEILF